MNEMRKVGRNDACPCGSGKKYKKCHGRANVIEITPTPYNHKLDDLHKGLIKYARREYRSELKELQEFYQHHAKDADKKIEDSYLSGVTAWGMIHKALQGEETIVENYYKKERNKIKEERTRQAFVAWQEVIPSIYEVQSVTADKGNLRDVRTNKEYSISRFPQSEWDEGDTLVGILLPYVKDYRFLYRIPLTAEGKENMVQLKEASDTDILNDFPDYLASVLFGEMELPEVISEDPQYQQVAELYTEQVTAKQVEEEVVSTGTRAWMMYTDKTRPTIRKPEAYAAALEYFVQQDLSMGTFQSQKDLAEAYGVSTTTISKHRRDMKDVLADEIANKFVTSDE